MSKNHLKTRKEKLAKISERQYEELATYLKHLREIQKQHDSLRAAGLLGGESFQLPPKVSESF